MNDFSERAEKQARFHELAEYPNISTGRQFAIRQHAILTQPIITPRNSADNLALTLCEPGHGFAWSQPWRMANELLFAGARPMPTPTSRYTLAPAWTINRKPTYGG